MTAKFQRGEKTTKNFKPDVKGIIVIKIHCRDPKSNVGNALMNGRKEEIVIEGSTVGKVYTEINKALFGDDEEA